MASSSHIQRKSELIFNQGEEFTYDIGVTDSAKVPIDLTAVTVTAITLRIYEFIDDAVNAHKLTLTGTVFDDGSNGVLRFTFVPSDTDSLAIQTYIMYVIATIDDEKVTVIKDNLTILRGINP